MSDSTDVIREALRGGEGRRELAAQRGEFEGADLAGLGRLDDRQLAVWQSNHLTGSPQWLWADQQWKLRLLERQAGAAGRQANKAAFIGGLTGGALGVAGAAVTAWLSWYLGKQ